MTGSDANMQNLLDAITTALQQGEDVGDLTSQADMPPGDVEGLAILIQSLHAALTPVEPSAAFSEELAAQLMNTRRSMVTRVRQMPARVHIAALLAVVAGFGLIRRRRIMGSPPSQDISEEPLAI